MKSIEQMLSESGNVEHLNPIFTETLRGQEIAQKMGGAMMAQSVLGWATKHLMAIPTPAFNELMTILKEGK